MIRKTSLVLFTGQITDKEALKPVATTPTSSTVTYLQTVWKVELYTGLPNAPPRKKALNLGGVYSTQL